MSELAFPEIDEQAATPVAIVEPKQATLKETALASFAPIVAHMTTLAQRYRNVAFDLLTPKGMAAAKAARLELREEGRYAVQRLQKRLKDEANDLKRTIDAKAEEAIAIVKPVEDAIHEQIEAREAQLAAEKAERERAEAERKAKHEAGIAKIRAYLAHCEQPGMTAARIQAGMDMLRAATFGPEWEEYAVPAANAQCETLEGMQRLHAAAVAREAEAARIEAQRLENERIAAEQRAQAEALAAQKRALAEQAAELARQQQEIEAARQRAITPAAPVATAAATEGKADNPEPGKLEAAPITQDAQESGFVPGTPGLYASSEAQAAQASPSGAEGRDARADECASQPDLWAVHVEGPDDIEAAPSEAAAHARADELNSWAKEKRLADVCVVFRAKAVPWPFTPEAHAEDLRKLGYETNTTSEAAPQQASDQPTPEADAAPGGTEGRAGRFAMSREWLAGKLAESYDDIPSCPGCGAMAGCCNDYPNCPGGPKADQVDLGEPIPAGNAQAAAVCPEAVAGHAADIAGIDWLAAAFGGDSIETSEREAQPYTPRVILVEEPDPDPIDGLLLDCLELVKHAAKAFEGRFPSHPKPEQSWWADLRERIDRLQPLLEAHAGEGA